MKKRIVTILLAVTVLTGTVFHPITEMQVFADATAKPEEMKSGDYRYAVLGDGTAQITGYTGKDGNLILPAQIDGKTVTSIGAQAFSMKWKLTNVVIPKSVKSIGWKAFSECTGLKSVSVPEGVSTIGNGAFSSCISLENIVIQGNNPNFVVENGVLYDKDKKTVLCCPAGKKGELIIPEGVTVIKSYAFGGCSALENVVIPDSVTEIEGAAFEGCSSLKKFKLPKAVGFINNNVFKDCSNLERIDIAEDSTIYSSVDGMLYTKDKTALWYCPEGKTGEVEIIEGVTDVHAYFTGCSKITSIKIPKSVSNINGIIYSQGTECTSNLKNIEVDSGNPDYASKNGILYNKAKTELLKCPEGRTGKVAIPEGVVKIATFSFDSCKLSGVKFPSTVREIEGLTFADCDNLTEVTIPAGVTAIGASAFMSCDKLSKVTIPLGVKTIGGNAFAYNGNIKDVYYEGSKEEWNKIAISTGNEALKQANIHYKVTAQDRVEKKIKVKKLSITGKKTMNRKTSQRLKLKVRPANADNQKVTWSSSNKKIATVTQKGKVKAKKKGTVRIIVKAKDGSKKKATFKIRVR